MTHCPHCGLSLDTGADMVSSPEEIEAQWFDAFWILYPRHVGKAAALKAWKRACTSEKLKDEIMAGLNAQLPGMLATAKRDKSFIPHASTFLNGRRWEDEAPSRPVSEYERINGKAIAERIAHDSELSPQERALMAEHFPDLL